MDKTHNLKYKNIRINVGSHLLLSQNRMPNIHIDVLYTKQYSFGCDGEVSAVSSSKLEEQDDSQSFFHKPETEDRELVRASKKCLLDLFI